MPDWNTLTIVGSFAVVCVAATTWINAQFRRLEKSFYKALDLHKDEDSNKFEAHGLRIQRLEIKNFGYTHSGK